MQANDREDPRDRELVLRHQHTASESRSLIPMWDSADPCRAPPPLPLNPGGPGSPVTRPNASATVQAAAAALAEKSQETVPSSYTVNPMPLKPPSPEKSLIKGQYHKRMQSLQNVTNSNEFASYLERRASPEKFRRNSIFDRDDKSADTSPTRGGAETTPNRDSPTQARISSRYLTKPIFGENTPPSATVLALRDMQIPMDLALPAEPAPAAAMVTTPTKPEKSIRAPESFDALSAQIISLTKIATSLQQEMSQLSRRSKDNATDLISLKAATNARDEDIRKSLKDLSANLSSKMFDQDPHTTPRGTPFIHPATGGFMLDNKSHELSPSSRKSFSAPRMASPSSFAAALERDLATSPGPISDGSASIALLEKVLREMATKEGQEKLVTLMEDVQARPSENDNAMITMLSEVLNLVKENSGSRALIRSRGDLGNQLFGDKPLAPDFGQNARSGPMDASPTPKRTNSDFNPNVALQPSSPLTDDMMTILKRVKHSVAEGGGLTSEVKALVRELRGEVLGMGRDLARKLEESQTTRSTIDQAPIGPGKEEIQEIVECSLGSLREQMEQIIEESRRISESSVIPRSTSADSQEVYTVVKRALDEMPLPQPQLPAPQDQEPGIQREEILEAVREAWETYKPEIELQNFGLERDEILDCLTEGLKAYQPQRETVSPEAVHQQVLDAVRNGLEQFSPPRIEPDTAKIGDELVSAVRECFESIEWPASLTGDRELTINRDDIISAVQEGLSFRENLKRDDVLSAVHEGLAFQEPIKKDDVFAAVQEGLASLQEPINREDVLSAVQEALATQEPFKKEDILIAVQEALAVQESIKREDILSAVQEGLASQEVQPREIEINRDDIFEALRLGIEDASGTLTSNLGEQLIEHLHGMILEMKDEFKEYSAANGRDTEQVLDATKDGFEVLRGQIESYVDRAADVTGKDEIIDTVKDGFRLLQSDVEKCIRESTERNPSDTVELLDAMEKEFEHLRQTLTTLLIRSNSASDKDEILDAIRELGESEALRKVDDAPSDKDEIIDAIREISESEGLKNNNSELADMVKQELEHLRQTFSMALVKPDSLDKEELLSAFREHLQEALDEHHPKKDGNESIVSNTNELLDAFHDGVEQLRAEIDKLHDKPVDSSLNEELLENLRDEIADLKIGVNRLVDSHKEMEDASTTRGGEIMLASESSIGGDIDGLKALVTQLQSKVEAIGTNSVAPEREADPGTALHKDDLLEVLEAIRGVHGSVNEVAANNNISRSLPESDPDAIKKGDLFEVLNAIKEVHETVNEVAANHDATRDPSEADPDAIKKGDLFEVLEAIKEVQGTVNEAVTNNHATRDLGEESGPSSSKEEIEALQALLQEMKTQLDEITPSASATWITAEKVEALEALAKETKETISVFATHIEIEGPSKEDVASLETIMKDVWVAVEDIKTAQTTEIEKEDPEKVVKADVQTLETLLFDLKSQIEELVLPDVETLPTKDDIATLTTVVNEFKEKMDAENEMTAQAFEARKVEHGGLAEKIEEAKLFIVDFREDLKTRFSESDGSLSDMKTLLECLNDSTETIAKADSIKELSELVKRESERSHGDREAAKVEGEERELALLAKIDEQSSGLKSGIEAEIDKKFQDVIAKYEDAQLIADAKFTAAEERDVQNLDALVSTKAIAEELKVVVGGMGESLTEACERMNDDAKTFFCRVDESFVKVDNLHEDVKAQHEDMKSQFDRAVEATERIESQISTSHPELLQTIKEVLAIVGQHYEHSQQSTRDFRTDLSALPTAITPLLPALLPPPPETKEPEVERYDDTLMHEKLDTIISHSSNNDSSSVQIEKLNALQEQLNATAREVSEMMASQSRKALVDYEDKKEEAMEAALALERRLAQKESVESELSRLRDEKDELLQSIRELRQEENDLLRNKIKLTKEVAGMETALRIRQEEVHLMEDRAEDLERRIVEGVLDHARSQLVGRHSGSDRMSLKRVPSSASTATRQTTASNTKGGSILGSSVNMALKRRSNKRANGSSVSNAKNERRILSLSNVSGNRGASDRLSVPYSGSNGGLASLKRSHSVKTPNQAYRRQSCDTRLLGTNKENEAFREEEENLSEVESDTGTERRTSYTGTYADSASYVTGSSLSADRRTSYGSSHANGSVAAESETWQEPSEYSHATDSEATDKEQTETEEHHNSRLFESEEGESGDEDDAEDEGEDGEQAEHTLRALVEKGSDMVLYQQPSDSGVGMTPA